MSTSCKKRVHPLLIKWFKECKTNMYSSPGNSVTSKRMNNLCIVFIVELVHIPLTQSEGGCEDTFTSCQVILAVSSCGISLSILLHAEDAQKELRGIKKFS
jgi:hypothetical protein